MYLIPVVDDTSLFDWFTSDVVECSNTSIQSKVTLGFGAVVTVRQTFDIHRPTFKSAYLSENYEFESAFGPDKPLEKLPPVQFRYNFPQPASSSNSTTSGLASGASGAVVSFKVTINGTRTITSKVKPSARAAAEFQAALDTPDNFAAILTRVTDDIFQMELGNIPWGSSLVVEVVYFQSLEYDMQYDGHRLSIPTNIYPRYGQVPGKVGFGPPNAGIQVDATNPDHGMFIKLTWDDSDDDKKLNEPVAVSCVSHPDAIIDSVSLSYSLNEKIGNLKDFVVIFKTKQKSKLYACYDTLDSSHFTAYNEILKSKTELTHLIEPASAITPVFQNVLAVSFNPDCSSDSPFIRNSTNPKEFIFIIDCSGSMHPNVSALKDALQLFMASLPPSNDSKSQNLFSLYFNLIKFGSHYQMLWSRSMPLNEKTFEAARSFIDGVDSDLGGTEILNPLKTAINSLRTPENVASGSNHTPSSNLGSVVTGADQEAKLFDMKAEKSLDPGLFSSVEHEIIILTDGEVFNVGGIGSYIEKSRLELKEKLRVHAIGIGNDVSHGLLNTVVSSGFGIKQHIMNNERMEIKVSRLSKAALSSPVNGVKIYWELDDGETTENDDDFEIIENFKAPLEFNLCSSQESSSLLKLSTSELAAPNAHIALPRSGLLPVHTFHDSVLYIFFSTSVKISPSVRLDFQFSDKHEKNLIIDAPIVKHHTRSSDDQGIVIPNYLFFAAAKLFLAEFERNFRNSKPEANSFEEDFFSLEYPNRLIPEKVGTDFGVLSPWTSLIAVEKGVEYKETDVSAYERRPERIALGSLRLAKSTKGVLRAMAVSPVSGGSTFSLRNASPSGSSLFGARKVSPSSISSRFGVSAAIPAPAPPSLRCAITEKNVDVPKQNFSDYEKLSIITKNANFDGSFKRTDELLRVVYTEGSQAAKDSLGLSLHIWAYLVIELKDIEEAIELLKSKVWNYVETSVSKELGLTGEELKNELEKRKTEALSSFKK